MHARLTIQVCALLLVLTAFSWAGPAAPGDVKSTTVDGRDVLIGHNPNLCPEMITITATLDNARCNVPLPLTVELPAGATRELCSFSATGAGAWHWHYSWHSMLGAASAVPDANFVYSLPYPKGRTYQVLQGFNGTFSHVAPRNFAIDWGMPAGSSVCAARDGLVVYSKADSDRGGPAPAYLNMANLVTILHSDGTLGEYLHLQKNGVLVKLGQRVRTGDVIGLSGNTGFTDTPHLHFHVLLPDDGNNFHTLPIQYRLDPRRVGVPEQGQRYTAP